MKKIARSLLIPALLATSAIAGVSTADTSTDDEALRKCAGAVMVLDDALHTVGHPTKASDKAARTCPESVVR